MKRIVFITLLIFSIGVRLFSQTNEYYLSIKIDDYKSINELTRIVSIDNVSKDEVIAYANDYELERLQKAGYSFTLLEHPSVQAGKAITMATTVAEMANWDRYPTYDVYNQLMQKFTVDYPNLCRLQTIGTSVNNRNMLVLNVTANINTPTPKPEVLLSSTMHGDETTGWILCMRLAHYLMSNYGTDPRITNMLDEISIFFAPNTNPDGTYYGGNNNISNARRGNANNYDLNRNFPDPWAGPYPGGTRQKETTIMMDYAGTRHFILGVNYHGGAEVVNYPWDGFTTSQRLHPDNSWFFQISRQYVSLAKTNAPSNYFTSVSNNGVTVGGDWYVIDGGRQDYMNYWHNCKEVCIEVSNTKMVGTENLNNFWNYNREAMMSFIEVTKYGIRGLVTDTEGEPLDATIKVLGHDNYNSHSVTNPLFGNYYRMIQPGTFTLQFDCFGYESQIISGVNVQNYQSTTILNVELQKSVQRTINGLVVNALTGEPITGVTVKVKDTPLSPLNTNESGGFTLDLMTGIFVFEFSKDGYVKKEQTVEINQDYELLIAALEVFDGFSFEDNSIPSGFTFSGNQNWYITNTQAYDGIRSIRSGNISDNQSTSMSYTFNSPVAGTVSYYAKVSTESGYDKFYFYIDNVSQGNWSGEINWTLYSFNVSAGSHTLRWEYTKDYSLSSGLDAVFVDFISLPGNIQYAVPCVNPRSITLETEEFTGESKITLWNYGNKNLNFNVTIEDGETNNWLSISNTTGTVAANQKAEIKTMYDFNVFASGIYTTNLLIDVVDSVIVIPVLINFQGQDIGIPYVSPHSIEIETDEVTGTFTVIMKNIGNEEFSYSTEIEGEQYETWLSFSNNSGSLDVDEEVEFVLNYNFTSLSADIYNASLKIDVIDSIITVPISINYYQNLHGIPYIFPESVEFETDEAQGNFMITMSNIGNDFFSYFTEIEGEQYENWLNFSNISGDLEVDEEVEFIFYYDFSSLPADIYNASLKIDVIDSIITVPISINYYQNLYGIPYIFPQNIDIETNETTGDFIITMSNIGNTIFNYSTEIEGEQYETWLTFSNISGTLDVNEKVEFILYYDFTNFSVDIYDVILKIDVIDSTIIVPISISYHYVFPQSIEIETDENYGDLFITMHNIGNTIISYNAFIEIERENWLYFSNISGTLEVDEEVEFFLFYDFESLIYDVYTASLKIDVMDSIITVPISINYYEQLYGIPYIYPQSVDIETNGIGDFTVTMSNIGYAAFSYSADIETEQDNWLFFSKKSGILEVDEQFEFILQYDFTALEEDIYTANLNIDVSDSIIIVPIRIDYTISEIRKNEFCFISVHPNPVKDELIITRNEFQSEKEVTYTIYNNLGQIVMQGKLQSEITTINIERLAKGVYYLRIKDMFKVVKL